MRAFWLRVLLQKLVNPVTGDTTTDSTFSAPPNADEATLVTELNGPWPPRRSKMTIVNDTASKVATTSRSRRGSKG